MKLRDVFVFGIVALSLAGCSSPPEPTPVQWNKSFVSINNTIPQEHVTAGVIPSRTVNGHWSTALYDFKGSEHIYPATVWFAVVHSSRITVSTPYATDYFTTSDWLRKNGATALISYQQKTGCLACSSTDIYFSR